MPRVPQREPDQLELRPVQAPLVPTSAPEEAFGGGAALERLTAATRGLAQTGGEALLRFQDRADNIKVTEDNNAISQWKLDFLNNAKTGILHRQGESTLASRQEFVDGLREQADLIRKKQNSRQQAKFNALLARHEFDGVAQIEKDTATKIRAMEIDGSKAEISLLADQAIQNHDNETLREDFLKSMRAAIIRGEQIKYGPDPVKSGVVDEKTLIASRKEAMSKAHTSIVDMMVSRDQDPKEYLEANKAEIEKDDRRIIERMLKSRRNEMTRKQKQEATERRMEFQNKLWQDTVQGGMTLKRADDAFAAGDIDRAFYNQVRARMLDVNDDPAIPTVEKVDTYLELFQDFEKLRGSEVDEKGNLTVGASGNDLKVIEAFQAKVASKAKYLTKKQENDFYKFTAKNKDAARQPKVGILNQLFQRLRTMPLTQGQLSGALADAVGRIMPKEVPEKKAKEIAKEIGDGKATATNENKAAYDLGDIINIGGIPHEVIGFFPDGEPDVVPK